MSIVSARDNATRQDAIAAAIRAATEAESILTNPKTPAGARGIGLAHLAVGWAQIATAMAVDDAAWNSADGELASNRR